MSVQHCIALLVLLLLPLASHAAFSCQTDADCVVLLNQGGSFCDTTVGFCTNPYADGGCLWNHRDRLGNITSTIRKRACNSQDPPDAAARGLCSQSPFDYTEIRIEIQNWDSATFLTYLMQILLSELLQVPTSVETSFVEAPANFYQPHNRLEYGWADDERALNRSSRFGDCTPFTTKPAPADGSSSGIEVEVQNELQHPSYLACAHVVAESAAQWTLPFVQHGILEPNHPNGILGRKGWYVPLYTAKHDPSLLHYTGLMGQQNRHKLAATFKRPVTFYEYCEYYSPTNCTVPDPHAERYPVVKFPFDWGTRYDSEDWHYYIEGVYHGYFAATEKNDCTSNPTNCTGHIVDYPCGWGSFVEPTVHHLNIALESNGMDGPPNGFFVEQLTEVWRAANATKSHVMMHFNEPDALVSEFAGSEFSFERVTLPQPTQECIDNRLYSKLRCSENDNERLGDPAGTCDESPVAMQKLFSTALYKITKGSNIEEAFHSPAYDALLAFAVTDLQVMDFYSRLLSWNNTETKHSWGMRETACEWAVDNLEFLQGFMPMDYPRVIQQGDAPLSSTIVCMTLGSVATLVVVVTAALVYRYRDKRILRFAQVEFLRILLVGLLLIALGAIMAGLPVITNGGCVTEIWLIGLGYTLELVPLIVKQAAINKLVHKATRMQRFRVSKSRLLGNVILITSLEIVFLLLWTILDPPSKTPEYKLTDQQDVQGDTIVEVRYYCSSQSTSWALLNTGWNALLLLVATVYALQIRKAFDEFKESRSLAYLIYFQFMLVLFRLATYFLTGSMSGFTLGQSRSLIYSIDVIGACAIYLAPKIRSATKIRERNSQNSPNILRPTPRQYPVPIQRAFKLISNISSIILPEDDPAYEDEEDPSVRARGGEDNVRLFSACDNRKQSSMLHSIKAENSDSLHDKDMEELKALLQEQKEHIAHLEARLKGENDSCSATADDSLSGLDGTSKSSNAASLNDDDKLDAAVHVGVSESSTLTNSDTEQASTNSSSVESNGTDVEPRNDSSAD